MYKIKW